MCNTLVIVVLVFGHNVFPDDVAQRGEETIVVVDDTFEHEEGNHGVANGTSVIGGVVVTHDAISVWIIDDVVKLALRATVAASFITTVYKCNPIIGNCC